MQNAGLDEAQPEIKIVGRNINNFRYVDDTTLMAQSEEELKSLLMKVKEESEKTGLKLNIKKLRSWHPVPSLHGKYLSDPMDCSPPGSSIHGIFQARVLEWGATAFSVLCLRG